MLLAEGSVIRGIISQGRLRTNDGRFTAVIGELR
jgi:hypothetical protein